MRVEGAADVTLGSGLPVARVHVDGMQMLLLSRFVMDLVVAAGSVLEAAAPYQRALADVVGAMLGERAAAADGRGPGGPALVWEDFFIAFFMAKFHVLITRSRLLAPASSKSKAAVVGEVREMSMAS